MIQVACIAVCSIMKYRDASVGVKMVTGIKEHKTELVSGPILSAVYGRVVVIEKPNVMTT